MIASARTPTRGLQFGQQVLGGYHYLPPPLSKLPYQQISQCQFYQQSSATFPQRPDPVASMEMHLYCPNIGGNMAPSSFRFFRLPPWGTGRMIALRGTINAPDTAEVIYLTTQSMRTLWLNTTPPILPRPQIKPSSPSLSGPHHTRVAHDGLINYLPLRCWIIVSPRPPDS